MEPNVVEYPKPATPLRGRVSYIAAKLLAGTAHIQIRGIADIAASATLFCAIEPQSVLKRFRVAPRLVGSTPLL